MPQPLADVAARAVVDAVELVQAVMLALRRVCQPYVPILAQRLPQHRPSRHVSAARAVQDLAAAVVVAAAALVSRRVCRPVYTAHRLAA